MSQLNMQGYQGEMQMTQAAKKRKPDDQSCEEDDDSSDDMKPAAKRTKFDKNGYIISP